MNSHLTEAATEHFALQSNEIIKLKQSISNKVRNQKYNSNAKKTIPGNEENWVRKERGVQRKIRTTQNIAF